jgi:hypothetical protein
MPKPTEDLIYYTDRDILLPELKKLGDWCTQRSEKPELNGATTLSILRDKVCDIREKSVTVHERGNITRS